MVSRMTTKKYNGLFLRLIDLLEKVGPAHAGETFVEHLARQTEYASHVA